jgi:hypothetical protein
VDVLDGYLLGWGEVLAPGDEGVGVVHEILQLFAGFERVYLSVEQGQVLVVVQGDLHVFPADLVADGAEVEVF